MTETTLEHVPAMPVTWRSAVVYFLGGTFCGAWFGGIFWFILASDPEIWVKPLPVPCLIIGGLLGACAFGTHIVVRLLRGWWRGVAPTWPKD